MPLDPSFIGRTYPPTPPYEVGREKVREFAAALGADDPAYTDPAAAQELGYPDVIAPPTFTNVVAYKALDQLIEDPQLGLDYSRVVHGDQRFTYARPVRAGDVLRVTVTVENIRSAAGNDLISTRSDVATVDGEHVCSSFCTLVARGTAEEAGA